MGRFRRLGINTILIFIGTFGSKLIALLMLPLYTRWLNVDEYGATDLVTTYSVLLLGIVSLSICDSIFIFPKGQPSERQKQYFSSGLIMAVATSFLLLFLCSGIVRLSVLFGWQGFFIDHIWSITFLLISNYIQQFVQQFNRSIDKMNVYAFTGLVQTIGMVAVSFIIIPQYKVNGYIASLVIGNAIGTIYSFYAGKANTYFSLFSWDWNALKEMLKYSIPIIPNGIMWFLINSINRPLLESYHGLVAVGLIAIANKIPTLVNQVYMVFHNAFIISAIEESATPNYRQFYNKTLKAVVVGQIIFISFVSICGKWIIQLFTTSDYYSSWHYIPLMLVGVLTTNIATYVGTNFTVNRKSKYFFYSTVWAGASALVFNLLLIPKFAIWGSCMALVLSQSVGMLARIKYSWTYAPITNIKFFFYNILLLATVVTVMSFGLDWRIQLLTLFSVAVVFYSVNRNYIYIVSNIIQQKICKNL